VGIIAVLAAVIVPNIGKFIGTGEQGAKDAEWERVSSDRGLPVGMSMTLRNLLGRP